mmetsp:Transcript_7377/g.23062  ORF Transcript_7377/g.23062 Transcript_7377/m.23062 type:complete len:258 (-) Transcript_7377:870-1643(-)
MQRDSRCRSNTRAVEQANGGAVAACSAALQREITRAHRDARRVADVRATLEEQDLAVILAGNDRRFHDAFDHNSACVAELRPFAERHEARELIRRYERLVDVADDQAGPVAHVGALHDAGEDGLVACDNAGERAADVLGKHRRRRRDIEQAFEAEERRVGAGALKRRRYVDVRQVADDGGAPTADVAARTEVEGNRITRAPDRELPIAAGFHATVVEEKLRPVGEGRVLEAVKDTHATVVFIVRALRHRDVRAQHRQ